jgi:hypothetical protein
MNRDLRSYRYGNWLLVIASILFSCLAVVALFQVFYKPTPVYSGWKTPKSERFRFEKNQLGFRGQPIQYSDNDFVVLLLGDSQVEATACAFDWMPEKRLQDYLGTYVKNIKAFSLGTSGYGQDQQLLMLREYYQQYRADLVLLWETPENDIWNNIFPTHMPTNGIPKPTFWLQYGQLKGPHEQLGQELYTSPVKLLRFLGSHRYFVKPRDQEWETKYLPEPYSPMTEYKGPVNREWQERWDTNRGGMRSENLNNEKSNLAIKLMPRSPRMQYGLDLTRALLREITNLVYAHSGKFSVFRTSLPLEGTNLQEEVYVLNGKYYMTSQTQFVQNLSYKNKGFDYHVIPVTIEKWRVGPSDAHLGEHAVDQVMKDLANQIAIRILNWKLVGSVKSTPIERSGE